MERLVTDETHVGNVAVESDLCFSDSTKLSMSVSFDSDASVEVDTDRGCQQPSERVIKRKKVSGLLPVESLWIIKHPSSPKVTITNFSFGNLNNMDTSAHGIEDTSVHAC